jgi:hypothetical protein
VAEGRFAAAWEMMTEVSLMHGSEPILIVGLTISCSPNEPRGAPRTGSMSSGWSRRRSGANDVQRPGRLSLSKSSSGRERSESGPAIARVLWANSAPVPTAVPSAGFPQLTDAACGL